MANFNLDLYDGEGDLDDISTAKPFNKGEWFVASDHVRKVQDSFHKDYYNNYYYFVKAFGLLGLLPVNIHAIQKQSTRLRTTNADEINKRQ